VGSEFFGHDNAAALFAADVERRFECIWVDCGLRCVHLEDVAFAVVPAFAGFEVGHVFAELANQAGQDFVEMADFRIEDCLRSKDSLGSVSDGSLHNKEGGDAGLVPASDSGELD
jgi:hypothetical protein